jgi:UDP-2,3-diacylglucosamine pyrophosphatase LpxH
MSRPVHRSFEIKTITRKGRTFIHAPFMANSDSHFGTHQCAAKNISHMEEYTFSERKYLIGDIIDGERLVCKKIWKLGPFDSSINWHREAIAHYLRKAGEGCDITYIPGNHDAAIRSFDFSGKTVYGIKVKREDVFKDPVSGFRWLIKHGDDYDEKAFNRDLWYSRGERLENMLVWFDRAKLLFNQRWRRAKTKQVLDEIEDYVQENFPEREIAAPLKKFTKLVIYHWWGVRDEVVKSLKDNPGVDGQIWGHSHRLVIDNTRKATGIRGFLRWQFTDKQLQPGDKVMLNDGSGTEYCPQAIWSNGDGVYALVRWHAKKGIQIVAEFDSVNRTISHKKRFYTWRDLGMSPAPPQHYEEDMYKARTDVLFRVFRRIWPSLDDQAHAAAAKMAGAAKEKVGVPEFSLPPLRAAGIKGPSAASGNRLAA